MGRCIVFLSHCLPGPAGLAPHSRVLQHPCGLPEALGCSSPPSWMPWTLSEDPLFWEKKSWELSSRGGLWSKGNGQCCAHPWSCVIHSKKQDPESQNALSSPSCSQQAEDHIS